MNSEKKTNWILWIGLAIPVITLLFVAMFAYAPSTFEAKYDFLYSYRDYKYGYCYNYDYYSVKNRQVVIATSSSEKTPDCQYDVQVDPPKIYRYDVITGETSQISLVDAQKLKIDNNPLSPESISIQRGNYNNLGIFEIFGGSNNYNSMYFRNNKDELQKINLGLNNSYDFMFIGWVLKQ